MAERSPLRIEILSVTYGDRGESLAELLDSALREGIKDFTFVENGCTQAAKDVILKYSEAHSDLNIRIIEFKRNRGSALAYQCGLQSVYRSSTADAVLLLDDDNTLPDNFIARLTALYARINHRITGRFALSLARPEHPDSLASVRQAGGTYEEHFEYLTPGYFQGFDLKDKIMARLRLRRPRPEYCVKFPDLNVVSIPTAIWGGLLLPRKVWSLGILPRADLTLYEEDTDFTERLTKNGVQILYSSEIPIHDIIVWQPDTQSRVPSFMIPFASDSTLWRYLYRNRNSAFTSRARCDSWTSHFRLFVNLIVRLILITAGGAVSQKPRTLFRIIGSTVNGLRGRLGEEYPLPQTAE
ncbi:Glycosyltransferase, GT2 family [Propionibacterium cyclohexanicum]|uniref:Glycosyltransferase, GT2 family n=1 Tax=Propionibacterium cyclohexanicum TaxID=64702 RepID=A0A1H9R2S7_9ACTN|nr:glycosyltransferase [Propionibacterium cyclohexanicum]SER67141.1 Glycosyltransferase, GT2 family [Propionibacterium cyclohexanicum]